MRHRGTLVIHALPFRPMRNSWTDEFFPIRPCASRYVLRFGWYVAIKSKQNALLLAVSVGEMAPRSLLALASLAVVSDLVLASDFSAHFVSHHSNPSAALPSRVIPVAEHSLQISGKVPRSTAKKNLRSQLRQYLSKSTSDIAPIAGSDYDEEYLVNGTIGGQHFSFIVDTISHLPLYPTLLTVN